jgi:hypothetical protein
MSPGARHSLPRHRRIPDPAGRAHPAERRAGAVTLIQRFGSALNLNIHFHTHYDKAKHLMATLRCGLLGSCGGLGNGSGRSWSSSEYCLKSENWVLMLPIRCRRAFLHEARISQYFPGSAAPKTGAGVSQCFP